jgi:glycerol kinase
VRATVESLAYQSADVITAMGLDAGTRVKAVRVDGGACANDFLMQFQADILDTEVIRPKIIESTALGAAYLAGLAVGYYKDQADILQNVAVDKVFKPAMADDLREKLVGGWQEAVHRSRGWEKR